MPVNAGAFVLFVLPAVLLSLLSLLSVVNGRADFALRFKLNYSGTNDHGYIDDVVVAAEGGDDKVDDGELKYLTGTISVKSYGAKGDGVTDDTQALGQAAQAANGKTLLIDPGTYLTAGLTLNGPTKVSAQGATLKLTFCSGDSCFNAPGLLVQKTALIDGIGIDGNGTRRSGVIIRGHAGTELRNCIIKNIDTADVGRSPSSVLIDHANNFLVTGCTIESSKMDAIDIIHANSGVVHNNTVQMAVRHGITLWDGDSATVPSSQPRNIYDVIISDNRIYNVTGGIWAARGDRITITNNYVENCDDVGIDYEGTINSFATFNRVRNAKNGGLTTFYGARNIEFKNNEVVQELGYGNGIMIYGNGASEDVRFIGNTVTTQNTSTFFTMENVYRNSLIQGNLFTSRGGAPSIQINRGGGNRIFRNTINVGDYDMGIVIQGSNGNTIEKNTIITATQPARTPPGNAGGVHLYGSSSEWPAEANVVIENTIRGFYSSINDNAWWNRINYNKIEGNKVIQIFRPCGAGYRSIIRNNTNVTTGAAVGETCF
jgi:parallel beta-helix repeat protein